MNEKFKPGEQVPKTADYTAYDKNGKNGGTTHLQKGKRFPATQHKGSWYEMEREK